MSDPEPQTTYQAANPAQPLDEVAQAFLLGEIDQDDEFSDADPPNTGWWGYHVSTEMLPDYAVIDTEGNVLDEVPVLTIRHESAEEDVASRTVTEGRWALVYLGGQAQPGGDA